MLKRGDQAPDFTLRSLQGEPVSLASLLQKGRLLLGFLKISCPTCQYTFPFIERLRAHNVVSVSQNDLADTRDFNQRFGLTVPTLLDPEREHYPVSNAYGLTHVPTFYLLEPDGLIAQAFSGFSRADLEDVAAVFGAALFRADEKIPALRPG